MSKIRSIILFWLLALGGAWAQYPHMSIRQIQEVPLDSLRLLDSLYGTPGARWTLQTSPYMGDTVEIVAVCIVPAKVITNTAAGFTMLLSDTGVVTSWGGVLVRVNSPTDTSQAIAAGFLNVKRGDVITLVGIVDEFPAGSPSSVTQLRPVFSDSIIVIDSASIPPPFHKVIGDFNSMIVPLTRMRFSTGEPFESLIVEFTNVVVASRSNSHGTFSMVDSAGNQMMEYNVSRYFQLTDSVWSELYSHIVLGTLIDTIRGYIISLAGGEISYGYRIAPIFRGDVVLAPTTSVYDQVSQFPYYIELMNNYPNPFNPSTMINYQIAMSNWVTVKVYNILGQEVRTLVNERRDAGVHRVQFHAEGLPSGVYFYRLSTTQATITKKMLLLR